MLLVLPCPRCEVSFVRAEPRHPKTYAMRGFARDNLNIIYVFMGSRLWRFIHLKHKHKYVMINYDYY